MRGATSSMLIGAAVAASLGLAAPSLAEPISAYPADVAVPHGARAGTLHLERCEYRSKADDKSYAADCGVLVVPENHGIADGRLIALPLIRLRAIARRGAEPIFTFKGGPGGSNALNFPIDALVRRHDIVLVGYRGVDGSVKLDCPEVSEHIAAATGSLFSAASLAAYRVGVRACAAGLKRRGIDLAGYTMVQTVDDQETARKALGYGAIDLLGGSYGTRLEMIYMWRYPRSIRRAVMVGVNPPGHFVWDPVLTDAKIVRYAVLCAKDAYCRTRTKDLAATMHQVSANMPASWLGVPIDADRVRLLSFFMMHETIDPGTAPVPLSGPAAIDAWLDAADGDASGLALLSTLGPFVMPRLFSNWGHFFAMGASDYENLDPAQIGAPTPKNAIIGAPGTRLFWEITRDWPRIPGAAAYGRVQPSDVETLLIAGTLDVTTPPEPARMELLPRLSHGHLVTLSEFGHTATFWKSQPIARARLLGTFFDSGRVDSSLYAYQPPVFDVEKSLGGIVRQLLSFVVVVLLGLAGLIWLVVARWRRRSVRPA